MIIVGLVLGMLLHRESDRATQALGPITVAVSSARLNAEDVLVISLSNSGDQPVEIELRKSPCSSTELATTAFLGKGAIGTPKPPVGIVEYVLPVKQMIAAKATYTCTLSISRWYKGRWSRSDRPFVKIFWAYEPFQNGIFDKRLYGGVVKLP